MELSTIEVAKDEARARVAEYREAIREKRADEDEQIMRAYRELAKGTPLIRLTEAIVAGGTVMRTGAGWREGRRSDIDIELPAIAVARADGKFAWSDGIKPNGSLTILGKRTVSTMNRRHRISLPAGTFPEAEREEPFRSHLGWGMEGAHFNALIPPVPPLLRPKHHLRNYHVLFEADWQRAPGPPPGDPALLKHVGGDLYAVLAVWDLTEVERAVLSGRDFPEE